MESAPSVTDVSTAPTPASGRLVSVYVLLTITTILWGGTWPAGRVVADTMDPWNAAFIRFFIATGPMIILCVWKKGRPGLAIRRCHLPRLVVLGLVGIFGYSACFFIGLQTTEAARGALIIGSIPACIALVSIIFLGDRLKWFGTIGIATALVGVGIVLSNGSPGSLLSGQVRRGDLFILGCVVCWTSYTLIAKPLIRELPPLVVATWACIFGTIFLAPFAFAAGTISAIREADTKVWANLVYLALGGTSLAYFWYYYAMHALGPIRTGIFINLVPVFGVLFGCLALNETLHISLLLGGLLVITGVTLTVRAGKGQLKAVR